MYHNKLNEYSQFIKDVTTTKFCSFCFSYHSLKFYLFAFFLAKMFNVLFLFYIVQPCILYIFILIIFTIHIYYYQFKKLQQQRKKRATNQICKLNWWQYLSLNHQQHLTFQTTKIFVQAFLIVFIIVMLNKNIFIRSITN